jgi:hypothetical protein
VIHQYFIYTEMKKGAQINNKNTFNKSNIFSVKAIPLQASTGPEGSRRLRLPDLKTIGT